MYDIILHGCFSGFWVFCSGYLMFLAVIPFFRFEEGLLTSAYYTCFYLLLLTYFEGCFHWFLFYLFQNLLTTALHETNSREETDRRQFFRIKYLSSISIDQCHSTIRTIYTMQCNATQCNAMQRNTMQHNTMQCMLCSV